MADAKPKKQTRPPIKVDYEQLKSLAANMMSCEDMATCMGIGRATFYKYQKRDKKFREAIEFGKAIAISKAASTIRRHAFDEFGKDIDPKTGRLKVIKEGDPNLCLKFLEKHAVGWKSDSTLKVKHSGTVEQNVHLEVEVDDSTLFRMCETFAQLNSPNG